MGGEEGKGVVRARKEQDGDRVQVRAGRRGGASEMQSERFKMQERQSQRESLRGLVDHRLE